MGDALDDLLEGMEQGSWRTRSGEAYRPATVRKYRQSIDDYVRPQLGRARMSSVRRRDLQAFIDGLHARGLAPRTVRNAADPLRVIFRRALRDDEIAVDPTDGLEFPAIRTGRDRIEAPEHAAELIATAPEQYRSLWAVLFYAGLRRGEARALRWTDVDLEDNVIRVARAWDDVEGEQEPKSAAGRRVIPLAGALRRELVAHRLRTGRSGSDLVFGRTSADPFVPSTVRRHSIARWEAAGLAPLTPHEARHCAASYFIAAGLNLKEISVYIGHTDIRTTMNVYGHLLPGGEAEAASKLDAFLGESAAS